MKKVILYIVVGVATFAIGYNVNAVYFSDRSPIQPIAFSHKIHAGDNNIPCMYCHIYADKSTVAGVPNVRKCIGCHKIIKQDAPEIQKLTDYWNRKEPIPWIKVHNLPDYVYFPHKRHVKAGVHCQTCHGDVAKMDVLTRVSSLKMGWCLDCHTNGAVAIIGREVKNGKDCWTCHK
ncbi:MAG: cytochrome c3 family protein [Deltaproteobacteria bacterium]|nr:cytochrome c3 family protein [Deltaproteobacteria bacterium]